MIARRPVRLDSPCAVVVWDRRVVVRDLSGRLAEIVHRIDKAPFFPNRLSSHQPLLLLAHASTDCQPDAVKAPLPSTLDNPIIPPGALCSSSLIGIALTTRRPDQTTFFTAFRAPTPAFRPDRNIASTTDGAASRNTLSRFRATVDDRL